MGWILEEGGRQYFAVSLADGESEIIPVQAGYNPTVRIHPEAGAFAVLEFTTDSDPENSAAWEDSGFGAITEIKTVFTIAEITGIKITATGNVSGAVRFRKAV